MKKTLRLHLSIIYLLLAICASGQSQSDQLKVIKNYKKNDSIKVEMLVDYCVANTFSNSDKNLELAKMALAISKKIKYRVGEVRALNCLGNYYYQQAIYDKATFFYIDALKISEKTNNFQNIVIGKSNLASIYNRTNQPAKALRMFKEADAILIKQGLSDSQNRAAILTNIGGVYSSLKKHKQAIEYHQQTLALCNKLKIPFGIAIATVNIGEEYVSLKSYQKAEMFLEQSQKISEEEGYDNFLSKIYKNLGIIYWNNKQQNKAILFLEKAKAVSEKINEQDELLKITQILHTYYSENNNPKKAYETCLKALDLNTSINGVEKQKVISETNIKYETEKKEIQIKSLQKDKEIAELNSEKQLNLILILVILFISILSTIYVLFNRYKIKKQNESLKTQLVETEKTMFAEKKAYQSELKAFKSQMNPHFFYNALNTVQSYILSNDKKMAISYLSKFSTLTRSILDMTEKENISVAEEIKTLELYLDIEKARFNDDFDFTISTENINDTELTTIPSMFLQPYVENALKHGLLHKDGMKKLDIEFKIQNNELLITIEDNGIGREKSIAINNTKNNKHNSFATEAMEKRIDILNKTRSKPISIYFIDKKDDTQLGTGTTVNIKIPI